MTPRELEKQALHSLKQVFVENREQVLLNEISFMLCKAMSVSRAKLFISKDVNLEQEVVKKFNDFLTRRLSYEPLAYILGEQEFYSLTFQVSRDVLIPRAETEILVEKALELVKDYKYLVDICSGSGAIVVSIAKYSKDIKSIAIDISSDACRFTELNAKNNNVDVQVLCGDLLSSLPDISEPVLFVSNPPYIPEHEILMPDVQNYEPKLALRGGIDGLEIIKKLLSQFATQVLKNSRNILLMEIGIGQQLEVTSAARELGLEVLDCYLDFQAIPRIIKIGKSK